MNLLCIDCSQKQGSLVLLKKESAGSQKWASSHLTEGTQIIAQVTWNKEKSHSEKITFALKKLLNDSSLRLDSIKALCISTGPGSFTGVRIGIAFGKSLAFALNIPIFESNSLKLLSIPYLKKNKITFALVNAYNNMAFAAAYQLEEDFVSEVVPLKLCSAKKALQLYNELTPDQVVGNGAFFFLEQKKSSKQFILDAQPQALYLDKACFCTKVSPSPSSWRELHPLYLKGSEAEEKLKRGLLKPL